MISKRIKEVAAFIPPATSIADIGCDHGHLIIEAFLEHNISFAIAVDNKEKPLQAAYNNIKQYSFYNRVRFSKSAGLSDIKEKIDVIVISGIGGLTALDIIKESNYQFSRYIVQANRNLYELRLGLSILNYKISRERIIKDGSHIYEIIEFIAGKENYNKTELEYGPFLLKEKHPLFIEKLKKQYHNLLIINEKTNAVKEKIKMLEEILC